MHIFWRKEMTGDFPHHDKVSVSHRGLGLAIASTRNAAATSHGAVRKSEGIAKICGEPLGGCAKLKSVSETKFISLFRSGKSLRMTN
jgi:hypothetical protein